jgi:predicted nucleic acid-binding protein
MTYILDACALIALLDDEEGKDKVDELFIRAKAGEIILCMSIINMLEVYYGFIRNDGLERADEILAPIDQTPLQIIDIVSEPVYKEAARLKGTYNISLADAIGLATAINRGGVFVTADGELVESEAKEHAPLFWFRPPKQKK